MKYFEYLPTINYSDNEVTNITVRAKIREFVLNNASVYYKHRIEDTDRPDAIATRYYGNSSFTWLVFYANNIFDPLFDWPLTHDAFVSYLVNKVGSLENAKSTPHHYLLDGQYKIDRMTYEDPNIELIRKSVVSIYDNVLNDNEKKREISIIDSVYARQITNEMKRLFK